MNSVDWKKDIRIAVLDMDGNKIKAGLFKDGSLIDVQEYDTSLNNCGNHIVQNVKQILRVYGEMDGIGISTAGQVDSEAGVILYANSNIIDYTGTKLAEILADEFHVPVAVENDVNAAAIGEAYYGAGIGFNDFICLNYGTGVGGAIIVNGDVYRGGSFSAGEMGAMILHPEDRNAKEDMYSGCYEKYASETALIRRALELDDSLTDTDKIFEAINRTSVRQVIDEWMKETVYGLTSLIHIFNPSCVILGGAVMKQEYVFDKVKKLVMEDIMESYRHVMISQAALGDKAGMFGAAYMTLKKLF